MLTSNKEFLVFSLGNDAFSIRLPRVREIVAARHVTRVPETPPFLIGVLNLRGKIVPVVDLRRKFGFADVQVTRDTSIIIVEAEQEGESALFGLRVDAIHSVEKKQSFSMDETPKFGLGVEESYIDGGFDLNGRYVVLLNTGCLLALEEFDAFL